MITPRRADVNGEALPCTASSRAGEPLADARRAVDDVARLTAFEQTFESTRSPFSAL
jgi:hypothetical protein